MTEFTKEFWDSKYPKIVKLYYGRQIEDFYNVAADVKCFITKNDYAVQALLQERVFEKPVEEIRHMSEDDRVATIQKWVIKHVKYVGEGNSKQSDFWQFPFETIAMLTGDCEDGCSLICSMLIESGFEPWRVRNTCGWVQESPTAPQGGHSYCTLVTQDNRVVPVDWCYLPQLQTLDKRPTVKDLAFYKDVWFSFNNEFCWSHENQTTFSGRVRK